MVRLKLNPFYAYSVENLLNDVGMHAFAFKEYEKQNAKEWKCKVDIKFLLHYENNNSHGSITHVSVSCKVGWMECCPDLYKSLSTSKNVPFPDNILL